MSRQTIYLSAGMFNADTCLLNANISDALGRRGIACYLPQRDSPSVPDMIRYIQAAKIPGMTEEVISEITSWVYYYLDLGVFVKSATAVVAVIDDPIDEGMVVEMATARFCNLPVIGVRTDLRSPFGNASSAMAINPFPVQQCDVFIRSADMAGNTSDVLENVDELIDQIVISLDELTEKKSNKMEESNNPYIQAILKGAAILYDGNSDYCSETGIVEMAKRYLANRPFFVANNPQIIRL